MSLNNAFEISLIKNSNYSRIVGIDEAGRGCWAGPVAIGAYIFTSGVNFIPDVDDSKKLKASTRENILKLIPQKDTIIKFASSEEIDNLGIAYVIGVKIQEIIKQLRDGQTLFIIDGKHNFNFGPDCLQVLKGDSQYYSVALGSIVAKVKRDKKMIEFHNKFPNYRFDKHKGYGTKLHKEMLDEFGICNIHRKSFKPISNYI
jgi:ribonuclease HII